MEGVVSVKEHHFLAGEMAKCLLGSESVLIGEALRFQKDEGRLTIDLIIHVIIDDAHSAIVGDGPYDDVVECALIQTFAVFHDEIEPRRIGPLKPKE